MLTTLAVILKGSIVKSLSMYDSDNDARIAYWDVYRARYIVYLKRGTSD